MCGQRVWSLPKGSGHLGVLVLHPAGSGCLGVLVLLQVMRGRPTVSLHLGVSVLELVMVGLANGAGHLGVLVLDHLVAMGRAERGIVNIECNFFQLSQ